MNLQHFGASIGTDANPGSNMRETYSPFPETGGEIQRPASSGRRDTAAASTAVNALAIA